MNTSNWTILMTVIVSTLSISFIAVNQMMISEIIYLNNENKRLTEVIFTQNAEEVKRIEKEAKRIAKEEKDPDDVIRLDRAFYCENYNSI